MHFFRVLAIGCNSIAVANVPNLSWPMARSQPQSGFVGTSSTSASIYQNLSYNLSTFIPSMVFPCISWSFSLLSPESIWIFHHSTAMGDLLLPASSLSKRHQRLALDPDKIDIHGSRPGSKARQGFTAEQIAECKELFQIFDKDGDGEIDRTEFLPMMKAQVHWKEFCSLSPLSCIIWTNND